MPEGNVIMYKKNLAYFFTILLTFSIFTACSKEETSTSEQIPEGIHIFIATDGNDEGDGSIENPFITFERAQQEVRTLRETSTLPITVNVRGGEYTLADSINLGHEDSGTATAQVTWQAYNGENVLLSGGIRLEPSSAIRVTDAHILTRVQNPQARAQLMYLDLSSYLDEIPRPVLSENDHEIASALPEVYINGSPLTEARWPNNEPNNAYLYADIAVAENGQAFTPVQISSSALAERATGWAPEAWEDMYVYAFMSFEWSDGIYDVSAFDAQNGTFVTTAGSWEVPSEHPRFFVFNVLEEIDVPGECYIDYDNRVIYFYPPEDISNADIYLANSQSPVFFMQDAECITIRGFMLAYTRANPILAYHVNNIIIDDCTVAHASQTGIVLDDAQNCIIRNCHIFDTEGGGIYLWDGGLRESLIPSGNIIENNNIHNITRRRKCYTPAILCMSVATIIRNNEIYDLPHIAIDLTTSNDTVVEYNEIYNVGLETSDMGAIYYGRDPSIMGIQIRYNYFHDIGNTYGGYGQQAIFCDDGASMPYIYGNIFFNASDENTDWGAAIKANGAQFGVIQNNIFIDTPNAATCGSWTFNWDRKPIREDEWLFNMYGISDPTEHNVWNRLTEDINFFSSLWRTHYAGTQWAPVWNYITPEGYAEAWHLLQLSNETDINNFSGNSVLYNYAYTHAPSQTNLFEGNVCVNVGDMFRDNGYGEQNITARTDIFEDYEARDFTITEAGLAIIRRDIPKFEAIPFDEIGCQYYDSYGTYQLPGAQ